MTRKELQRLLPRRRMVHPTSPHWTTAASGRTQRRRRSRWNSPPKPTRISRPVRVYSSAVEGRVGLERKACWRTINALMMCLSIRHNIYFILEHLNRFSKVTRKWSYTNLCGKEWNWFQRKQKFTTCEGKKTEFESYISRGQLRHVISSCLHESSALQWIQRIEWRLKSHCKIGTVWNERKGGGLFYLPDVADRVPAVLGISNTCLPFMVARIAFGWMRGGGAAAAVAAPPVDVVTLLTSLNILQFVSSPSGLLRGT